MNQPLVSIIIPTFNRGDYLVETITSIINQSYRCWECIIVDDHSTDNTSNIVKEYSKKDLRIKYVMRPFERKGGGNAARNYGFEISKGKYICWFDSDDIMYKENIRYKVELLENYPNFDYCISKVKYFDHIFCRENLYSENNQFNIGTNLYRNYITGKISILNVNPLWRRKILLGKILYDENIRQLQDLDFFSRIIYTNRKIGVIDKDLIFIRRKNNSITTANSKQTIDVPSFLLVKNRIINRTPEDKEIILFSLKTVLWCMRLKMSERDYKNSRKCLQLCLENRNKLSLFMKVKIYRISVFYYFFEFLKIGDTMFKTFLKF